MAGLVDETDKITPSPSLKVGTALELAVSTSKTIVLTAAAVAPAATTKKASVAVADFLGTKTPPLMVRVLATSFPEAGAAS
jgi:hypothetical protein